MLNKLISELSYSKILYLAPWAKKVFEKNQGLIFPTIEERMAFVIQLSRLNVEHQTGGPFGAAIFNRKDNSLISIGINQVIPLKTSLVHAEIMAIILAQNYLQTHNLKKYKKYRLELVTSSQPCIQCFGAIYWSGLSSLIVGARAEDVESIVGFDEGPIPLNWQKFLRKKGISVKTDILREEACSILKMYRKSGGPLY